MRDTRSATRAAPASAAGSSRKRGSAGWIPQDPPFRPQGRRGAIAQLGERLNGIQEVGGSIPPGSTKSPHRILTGSAIVRLLPRRRCCLVAALPAAIVTVESFQRIARRPPRRARRSLRPSAWQRRALRAPRGVLRSARDRPCRRRSASARSRRRRRSSCRPASTLPVSRRGSRAVPSPDRTGGSCRWPR